MTKIGNDYWNSVIIANLCHTLCSVYQFVHNQSLFLYFHFSPYTVTNLNDLQILSKNKTYFDFNLFFIIEIRHILLEN